MNDHSPLPWELSRKVNHTNVAIYIDRPDKKSICGTIGEMQAGDAAYIVKSANAYPRLVATLKGIVNNDETGEFLGAAALLHELGELK